MDIEKALLFLEIMDSQPLCLSATATRVLFIVATHPGITLTGLQKKVMRDRTTISHTVTRLKEYKLITTTEPTARQEKTITLTTTGENFILHILDLYYSKLTPCGDAHSKPTASALN